jgi:tetrahydromethanopterin S-methyltransferase subunit A
MSSSGGLALACAFEVKPGKWPTVPGDYVVLNGGPAPVAASTLASLELPGRVAALRLAGLAIVGKTETENIGLDKIIKNTVANPALRYLVVAGQDAHEHYPGQTLLALAQNGVDAKLRVIGSRGKRPVLRNVSHEEIEAFRQQVLVVDMIGCQDASVIASKVAELASALDDGCADASCACHSGDRAEQPVSIALSFAPHAPTCGCGGPCEDVGQTSAKGVRVIQAHAPSSVRLDKAGYFVVIVQRERAVIVTEHYDYDNALSGVIEGRDARSIYWTAIHRKRLGQRAEPRRVFGQGAGERRAGAPNRRKIRAGRGVARNESTMLTPRVIFRCCPGPQRESADLAEQDERVLAQCQPHRLPDLERQGRVCVCGVS